MLELMRYELKKLFSSVLTLVCIAVTIALLGLFCYRAVKYFAPDVEWIRERRRLCSEIAQGRSTKEMYGYINEKVQELEDEMSAYGEELPHALVLEQVKYFSAQDKLRYVRDEFPEHRRALIINALAAAELERAKTEPDHSIIALNELASEKYNAVIDLRFTAEGKLSDLLLCLDNNYWDYVMILLAVILTVRMFTLDRSTGAYLMLNTKLKSRRRLFSSQLISAFAVTAAIVTISAVSQLVIGMLWYGVDDLALPIQQFTDFEFCPYLITVGGYLLLKLCMKLMFYLFVAAVAVLMSVLTKRAAAAVPISALAAVIPQIIMTVLFAYTESENASALDRRYIAYDHLRCVLPQSFLNLKTYFFRFDYVTVFGAPVSRLVCAAAVTVIITLVCIFTAYKNYIRPAR